MYCSAVKALLAAGADPNLGDHYSTMYRVAREKNLNSLHGNHGNTLNAHIYTDYADIQLLQVDTHAVVCISNMRALTKEYTVTHYYQ